MRKHQEETESKPKAKLRRQDPEGRGSVFIDKVPAFRLGSVSFPLQVNRAWSLWGLCGTSALRRSISPLHPQTLVPPLYSRSGFSSGRLQDLTSEEKEEEEGWRRGQRVWPAGLSWCPDSFWVRTRRHQDKQRSVCSTGLRQSLYLQAVRSGVGKPRAEVSLSPQIHFCC